MVFGLDQKEKKRGNAPSRRQEEQMENRPRLTLSHIASTSLVRMGLALLPFAVFPVLNLHPGIASLLYLPLTRKRSPRRVWSVIMLLPRGTRPRRRRP